MLRTITYSATILQIIRKNKATLRQTCYTTCFDDASINGVTVLVNSMFSRLCCNYKRNKEFQQEVEEFDYSLDCIWISKSIKQLKDVTEEIMQQIPQLEGRRLPSYHSVIKEDNNSVSDKSGNQSINDRSKNYSINSGAPIINTKKKFDYERKILDFSCNTMNQPNHHRPILSKPLKKA